MKLSYNVLKTSNLKNNSKLVVNEGTKSFRCTKCDVSFRVKLHLNKHIRKVHEGKKPENEKPKEESIEQSDTTDANIQTNTKQTNTSVHERIKSFVCEICESSFKLKTTLKRHIKFDHWKRNVQDE